MYANLILQRLSKTKTPSKAIATLMADYIASNYSKETLNILTTVGDVDNTKQYKLIIKYLI